MSMLGDNNEHVLTYWVLWQTFHSAGLVGFEVISHWLPYLVLSVPFGALAERYDCRGLIQAAQALFMLVSACWAVLILTGTLTMWAACVLLVLHGCAGALWSPAEQMLLHDLAPPEELASAVRLNATFRSLGSLAGPVVGSALLFGLGVPWGLFVNVLFYVPMTFLMLRTPFDGHARSGYVHRARMTFADTFGVVRTVGGDRVLMGMIALTSLVGLCVGGSLQAAIPSFADRLGAGSAGIGYGALLFANGVGGVVGGLLLEASGVIRPRARAAVAATVLFGLTTVTVAMTGSSVAAIAALVVGGVASLVSRSVAQAIVQLRAPVRERGRVIGVFNMFGQGMRTANGLMLALVGGAFSVGTAVALGGAVLALGAAGLAWFVSRGPVSGG
ncbi:MFS transporter [Isoptericola aurantiacus]|uniref:MFS transporter n=1 Tax=Isoptericola aurantiacus TaxID=3377839 RepID=UPI00383B8014